MVRAFPMALLMTAAFVCTACNSGSSSVASNVEPEAEAPPLGEPMAPGASFTDLPPVAPPDTGTSPSAPSP